MRVCSGAGCLRAVKDDVRFCDDCKPAPTGNDTIREHSTAYDAVLDKLRTGSRWQRLRKLIVQRQPMCARCDLHYTEIVDHIVPAAIAIEQARSSGKYPLDKYAGYFISSNLQGLCRACHWLKTNEDKTHTGEWPDVVERELAKPKRTYSF